MKLRVKKYTELQSDNFIKFSAHVRRVSEEWPNFGMNILAYCAQHSYPHHDIYFSRIHTNNSDNKTELYVVTISDLCKKIYNCLMTRVMPDGARDAPSRNIPLFNFKENSKMHPSKFRCLSSQYEVVLPYILNQTLSQIFASAVEDNQRQRFINVFERKFPQKPGKIILLQKNKTSEPFMVAAIFSNLIYTIIPELFQFIRTMIRMVGSGGFFVRFNKPDEQKFVDDATIRLIHFLLNMKKESTPRLNTVVTLGLDPEFEIYTTMKSGKIDFKNGFKTANSYLGGMDSDVGVDGCSRIAEIRPNADESPLKVALNTKKLIQKMYDQLMRANVNLTALTGGGFYNSIGGHIHIGNKIFRGLEWNNQLSVLGKLLDGFLYFPIRENMPGAIRIWRSYDPEISPIMGRCDWRNDDVHRTTLEAKPKKGIQEDGYDIRSQFRTKQYGVEYRSLPSFLCDFTFTRLVLKITKALAEKFLNALLEGGEIEFNIPPLDEDYLQIITPKELRVFKTYIEGHRKTRLVEPIFNHWPIKKIQMTGGNNCAELHSF